MSLRSLFSFHPKKENPQEIEGGEEDSFDSKFVSFVDELMLLSCYNSKAYAAALYRQSLEMKTENLLRLLHLGVFDFPDSENVWLLEECETTRIGAFHANDVIASVLGVLENIDYEECTTPGYEGMLVWRLKVDSLFRCFHSFLCRRLTRQGLELLRKTDGLDPRDRRFVTQHVHETMATVLVTACALNAAECVSLIAQAFPETIKLGISIDVLGHKAWPWLNRPQSGIKANAYFYAVQFSSSECMDALQSEGHDPTQATGFGPGRYDLPALLRSCAPACRPHVLQLVLTDHLTLGSSETLRARRYVLYDVAKTEANCYTSRRRGDYSSMTKPYFKTYIDAGLFNLHINQAVLMACAEGLKEMLRSLLPSVIWPDFFKNLGTTWILQKSLDFGQSFNRIDVEDCMLIFLEEAVRQGWGHEVFMIHAIESEEDGRDNRRSIQPIEGIILAGMDRVLDFYIQHGFDVTEKMHPQAVSALSFADSRQPRIAQIFRMHQKTSEREGARFSEDGLIDR